MKVKRITFILASILLFSYFSYISIKIIEFKTGYNIESKITGLASFGAGLLLSRPKAGSAIMIIIILALVVYFNRGRIKNLIEKIRERKIKEV